MLAERLPAGDDRRRLRRLAVGVDGGGRRGRDLAWLTTVVGDGLDVAGAMPPGSPRWITSEALAWAVARVVTVGAGSRPPGGDRSAGATPLVERLIGVITPAAEAAARGDASAISCLLVAAALLPGNDRCRRFEAQAREALEADIDRLATADGAIGPVGADSAARVAGVARWAAVLDAVVAAGGDPPWSGRSRARFRAAGETALMLLGPGGEWPGADRRAIGALLAAIERDGGRRARDTARQMRRGPGDDARLLRRERGLAEGCQAVIRSGWDAADVRVFIDWRAASPWLEVAVGRRCLVGGPWSVQATVGGVPLATDGPWRMSSCEPCRHGTFLEVVQPLVGGGEIQRQIVVMAADRVVLLADALILPAAAGVLAYEGHLSLPDGVTVTAPAETRERLLGDGRPRCAVLPLALGEWTAAGGPGSFTAAAGATGGGLHLRQVGAGQRIYAPLWIDCDPRRSRGPLTWRQLTVADTRRILDRHEAAGFRVQAGLDQWLVYRALDEPRNRTLLGCNVACEFVLGRIKPRGRVGRSIEIE
jgi:hypothetical protein